MGLKDIAINITDQNLDILKDFFKNLSVEKKAFRYFESRGFEIIKNHVYTVVLYSNGEAVSYGHLDKEEEIVWLGILVKLKFQGQGFSNIMMELLINKASELKLKEIRLAVDKSNYLAFNLYKKFGFEELVINENNYILSKKI